MSPIKKAPQKFVAYYRVSTDGQERSGLGLEAQKRAVTDFLQGRTGALIGEFTEVESGKKNDRPKMKQALKQCELKRAVLVVAKLDRLARNVAFISNLMESKVEFVACDFPTANRLTIHVLAAVAEHEREMISQRTKDALASAKARGVKLGSPQNLKQEGRVHGAQVSRKRRAELSLDRIQSIWSIIEDLKKEGACTLIKIADGLNEMGFTAPRGGKWYPAQVKYAMDKMTQVSSAA